MILLVLAAITTVTGIKDLYPSASPDGSALVFNSNRSGRQALWIAKPDGSQPRILFDDPGAGTDPGTAQWSPDGSQIVFAMTPAMATDPNESEIYLIKADGTALKRLTNAPGDDSHPHWSADGKRIFFNSARATPDLKADWGRQWIDIYSMAADGTGVERITDCKSVCTFPWPSPDGRRVAYRKVLHTPGYDWSQKPSSTDSEIFVAAVDGSSDRNLSRNSRFDGWPSWSPDGQWIAWASGRDGKPNAAQIYRAHPDGSDLERITVGPFSYAQPSFAGPRRVYVYQEIENGDAELGGIARVDLPSRRSNQ